MENRTQRSVDKERIASKKAMIMTLVLAFMFAMIEGFDLQSTGVAAPRMKAEMLLTSTEMGWIFSAAVLGTLPGALIAGRIADSIGRKKVLITCIVVFGLMSLLTPFVDDYIALSIVRFLTGLGMGGALPIVITMVSEAVPEKYKATAVSSMYCGMPIGGFFTSVVALSLTAEHEWRFIFYIGGIAPLILVPILFLLLPESMAYLNKVKAEHSQKASMASALFAKSRGSITTSLWLSFFGTLLVLTLLQNWLPTLISGLGLSKQQASYIQIGFNLGGSLGVLILGFMLDRMNKFIIVCGVYTGILISLIGLAYSSTTLSFTLSAAGCGMFVMGCQSILYSLAAKYYPTEMRGTGVGAAVAVGRIGSFVGPLFAGYLLSIGQSEVFVIAVSIPMILLAAISALFLMRRPEEKSTSIPALETVKS